MLVKDMLSGDVCIRWCQAPFQEPRKIWMNSPDLEIFLDAIFQEGKAPPADSYDFILPFETKYTKNTLQRYAWYFFG